VSDISEKDYSCPFCPSDRHRVESEGEFPHPWKDLVCLDCGHRYVIEYKE
jgi:transposase-like protein